MLVVIPYWQGDEGPALRLADWMRELGPYPGHSLMVERDVRCPTRQVFERMGLVGFDNVEEIVNPQRIDGWPQGGNSVFQFAARHISYTCPQPWLFLEPDAVPMRRNWIDELEKEYKASDKDFLGDFVSIHTPEMDVPDHMSGVGIYPPDLIFCKTPLAGQGLICSQLAWDVVIGQHILPHNMHNSKFLSHAWKHPTFQDWEQVRREIFAFKPDCVLFHASKDGSLILRLQEQRAREAGFKLYERKTEAVSERARTSALPNLQATEGNHGVLQELEQHIEPICVSSSLQGVQAHPGSDLAGKYGLPQVEAEARSDQAKSESKPTSCAGQGQDEQAQDMRTVRSDSGSGSSSPGLCGSVESDMAMQVVSRLETQSYTCDILIKSYPKDYEWLSYCLRGLEKFATGFRRIIVVHPYIEAAPQLPADQPIPIATIQAHEQGEPYLWQQVVKFNAHEYTNATYVLHIDSDTVATAPFTPETFIRDGKPLWLMTPYSSIKAPWQPITEKFLGERVKFEFMRRFPMLIPRSLHVAASKFVEIRHNKSAAEYIISQPAHDFSEFNALGALAYSRARDDFSWLDTTKEELPELVAIQSWSHGGLSDELREKFENILSGEARTGENPIVPEGQGAQQHGIASPAQSLLVGDGLAHAADESPAVPVADQTLYEKEKEPVCDEGKRAAGNLGESATARNSGGAFDRTSPERHRAAIQNKRGDDACAVSLPDQETQRIHQTKEGWWVIFGDTHISKWVEEAGRLDEDQRLLPKILPEINEGDVVVDAGAFIGDHSIAYIKAVAPKDGGKVICFEPNPLAAECLRRNIGASLRTLVYEVALSSENMAYPFEISDNAGASSVSQRSKANIRAIPLDSMGLKELNFFKIDVEGHELSVLKGAEETIMRCKPKLLIDIHKWPLLRQKVEAKAIFDWLKSHGYRWSSVQPMHIADPPQYDILCRPVSQGANVKKLVPWASPLETKEEISRLISRLNDFVIGASPSQIRFVRQELVVQGVTRRPRDYNWVVIRKKRNAMKRRLAKGIKDE